MFLQPPEELVGPACSTKLVPSFWPSHQSHVLDGDLVTSEPGYLLQARNAVSDNPDNPIALARLAQAAQAVGNEGEAIECARRALALGLDSSDPGPVHAAMTILTGYGNSGDTSALIDDPRAEDMPVGVRVRAAAASGEFDAAQRFAGVDASPDALAVITWIRLEQRDFAGAIGAGRDAERGGAAGVTLYVNLGYAHAGLGNLKKAIRLTRQAHALSPLDRPIAFSLAHYLSLAGRGVDAMDVLHSLQEGDRLDIELALAIAKALTDTGALPDAHRVLQRVRASQEWAVADDVSRAELTANLALLRWMTRRDRADSSLKDILQALQSCDYQSIGTAYLLMNLMHQPVHARELARVIGRLETRHHESQLFGLRMLLAILGRDSAAAVDYARAWAEHDLFNPYAATTAILLVGEVAGDFHSASELGRTALRRAPTNALLLNNTAFVLAMDGQPLEAQRLLDSARRQGEESVYLSATQGLVDLLTGRIEQGRERYRHAREVAEAQHDNALAARVTLYAAFAEQAAEAMPEFGDPQRLMDDASMDKWRELPLFWIATERLRRERA